MKNLCIIPPCSSSISTKEHGKILIGSQSTPNQASPSASGTFTPSLPGGLIILHRGVNGLRIDSHIYYDGQPIGECGGRSITAEDWCDFELLQQFPHPLRMCMVVCASCRLIFSKELYTMFFFTISFVRNIPHEVHSISSSL